MGCSPWGHKESDMTKQLSTYTRTQSFLKRARHLLEQLCVRASQVAPVIKNPPGDAGDMRHGFDLWVGKVPWRRAWQPTPVFLPGESHGQRNLEGTVHRVAQSWTQLKRLSSMHGRRDSTCISKDC